jgi:hypothetical protein
MLGLYNLAVATDSDEFDKIVLLEGVPPDGREGYHIVGSFCLRAVTGSGQVAGVLVTHF